MTERNRFAEIDDSIAAMDERLARIVQHLGALSEHVDTTILAMDDRLRAIARQNEVLGEMVEVLGGYVNTSIEHLQGHASNPEAHRDPHQ